MRRLPLHLILAATLALSLTTAGFPLLGRQAAANDRMILVRAGQTLSGIAAQQGVSLATLVRLNGITDPDRIYPGQPLRVGTSQPAGRPAPRQHAASISHRVAHGETLSAIAARYRSTVSAIAAANRIGDPSYIRTGQLLSIPRKAARPVSRPAAAPAGLTHRVAYGETLSGIAARYRSTVSAIAAANRIGDPSYIRAGQLLSIPRQAARPAPSGSRSRPGRPHRGMPTAMAVAVAARQPIARLLVDEARRQGVPAALALALAWQESGWQARVVSSAGAIGVMQLLPSTADWVAHTMLGHAVNPWDPASNVRAGVRLLKHYLVRYGGNRQLALAAYYQGQTAADRHGIYPISRPYIGSILALEDLFSR